MKSVNRNLKLFNGTKFFIGLMTLFLMLLITSCGDDDNGAVVITNDIVEIASDTEDLTSLVAALSKFPDLVTALSDDAGSYTVFAPTNDAFSALLTAIGQSSIDDVPEDVLKRILEYHVIAGSALLSSQLTDGTNATTLLNEDVAVTVIAGASGTEVSINSSDVTTPDVNASNGVVHIIDAVLVPSLEASILNTIVEPAYFNKNYSILTAAVVKAELLTTLLGAGPFTLFAPNNEAFTAAGITSLDNLTKEDLTPILQYHVLNSEVKQADLPATGSAVTTLNGDFYLSINTNGVYINGSTQVTNTDLDYDNGVVHTISRTLTPSSQNVVEIAVAASEATSGAEFGQLVAALTAVENDGTAPDLITALSDANGSFTVFAPTDAAFQALYDKVPDGDMDGDNDIDDLVSAAGGLGTIATVLQYHVLNTRVFSTDIPNVLDGNTTATITPLAGGTWTLNSTLTITDVDGALTIGTTDAEIIDTNILGTNGVIHVINQVILP
ncbi:MAG: fasciclin domain-containing protein [Bacteroidota bacterium]